MNCPRCNKDTKVIDSRRTDKTVHRKRGCTKCGFRFFTKEVQTNSDGINQCYRSIKEKNHAGIIKGDAESNKVRRLTLALENLILYTRAKKTIGETKEISLPDVYQSNEIFMAEVTCAMKYRIPLIVADPIISLYKPILKFLEADIKIQGIMSVERQIKRKSQAETGERKAIFGSSTVIKGTGVNMEIAKEILKGINIIGFE